MGGEIKDLTPSNTTIQEKVDYPFVECDLAPGPAKPGYAVCEHINGPADVRHLELATPTQLGLVSCDACYAEMETDTRHAMYRFQLSCPDCLAKSGVVPQLN